MAETTTLTDKRGRTLQIRHLTAADQFDLLEAAGNRADYNQWFGMAALVFSCVAIDGVPLPTPHKPEDFKKNAVILMDDGIKAIAEYFVQQNAANEEAAADELETAKN